MPAESRKAWTLNGVGFDFMAGALPAVTRS
jgi:hypothetical protein